MSWGQQRQHSTASAMGWVCSASTWQSVTPALGQNWGSTETAGTAGTALGQQGQQGLRLQCPRASPWLCAVVDQPSSIPGTSWLSCPATPRAGSSHPLCSPGCDSHPCCPGWGHSEPSQCISSGWTSLPLLEGEGAKLLEDKAGQGCCQPGTGDTQDQGLNPNRSSSVHSSLRCELTSQPWLFPACKIPLAQQEMGARP